MTRLTMLLILLVIECALFLWFLGIAVVLVRMLLEMRRDRLKERDA